MQLFELAAQRSEVCFEFLHGEPHCDVLRTVPVEGLDGDQNRALDDGVVGGIGEAPDQSGVLFGGDDASAAIDLQPTLMEIVHGDQGDRAADVEAADELLAREVSALDVALALDRQGFEDVAEAVVGMLRQRIAADYLQTSAVIEPDGLVRSAVNDPNLYLGPGTGYRLEGERWALLQSLPHVVDPRSLGAAVADAAAIVEESGPAVAGNDPAEVVIAVGPAFADGLRETIAGLPHDDVLAAVADGVREAGGSPRVVRILRAADVAFIGHDGAVLSGSGVALGLQSKGTAVIHRADLQPLDNLELFGMSPLYTLDSYRAMGRNAAGYALGQRVGPVPTELDNFARAKLIVRTTLLHAQEARAVVPGAEPVELDLLVPQPIAVPNNAPTP